MGMETICRLGNEPTLLHVWEKCRHERAVDIVCVCGCPGTECFRKCLGQKQRANDASVSRLGDNQAKMLIEGLRAPNYPAWLHGDRRSP